MVYSFPHTRTDVFRPFDGGGGNDRETVHAEAAPLLKLEFATSAVNLVVGNKKERILSLFSIYIEFLFG